MSGPRSIRLVSLWALCAVTVTASALPGAASTRYPLTLHDALGARVVIAARPRRVISLAPSVTEILFAIGLDHDIVGISDADNYPPQKVANRVRIGSVAPNIERIVALRPDLVLGMPSLQRDHLARLRSLGVPVLAVEAGSLADVLEQILLVGRVLDREAEAGRLARALGGRARAVRDGRSVSVYVEAWHEPLLVAAGGTLIDDLVRRAGGRNVFGDRSGYVRVASESVIAQDPHVILLMYPGRPRVIARAGWRGLAAVIANRVHEVPTDLVSRPGPRAVDGLELIARLLQGAGQP